MTKLEAYLKEAEGRLTGGFMNGNISAARIDGPKLIALVGLYVEYLSRTSQFLGPAVDFANEVNAIIEGSTEDWYQKRKYPHEPEEK